MGWKTCVPAWQAEGWAQGSKMRACLRGQVRAAVAGVQSWCACYMRARAEPTLTCLAARRTCTCGRSTEDGTRRTAHGAQRAAMARPIAMAPELAPAPPAQPHHPHHPLPHVSTEASADYRDGNDAHARLVGSGVGVRVGVPELGRRGWGPPTRAGGGAWPRPTRSIGGRPPRRPAAARSGPAALPLQVRRASRECLQSREARPEGGRRHGGHGALFGRAARLGRHGEGPLLEVDDAAVLGGSGTGALGWLVGLYDVGALGLDAPRARSVGAGEGQGEGGRGRREVRAES